MEIEFDNDSSRKYLYYGLDRCVVYFRDEYEPWFGVVNIELESESDTKVGYIDGESIVNQLLYFGVNAKVGAYTFPDDILEKPFNLVWRVYTNIEQREYELHILYNCTATLENTSSVSMNTEPHIDGFNLYLDTTPKRHSISGYSPITHVKLNTEGLWVEAIERIESILYGDDKEEPRCPSIDELVDILEDYAYLKITDHGDGTWTAEEVRAIDIITMVEEDEFEIDWASAIFIGEETYTIETL